MVEVLFWVERDLRRHHQTHLVDKGRLCRWSYERRLALARLWYQSGRLWWCIELKKRLIRKNFNSCHYILRCCVRSATQYHVFVAANDQFFFKGGDTVRVKSSRGRCKWSRILDRFQEVKGWISQCCSLENEAVQQRLTHTFTFGAHNCKAVVNCLTVKHLWWPLHQVQRDNIRTTVISACFLHGRGSFLDNLTDASSTHPVFVSCSMVFLLWVFPFVRQQWREILRSYTSSLV